MLEQLAVLIRPGFELVFCLIMLTVYLWLKKMPVRLLYVGAVAGAGAAGFLFFFNKYVARLEMVDVAQKGLIVFSFTVFLVWLWFSPTKRWVWFTSSMMTLLGFSMAWDKSGKLIPIMYSALSLQNGLNSDWVIRAGATVTVILMMVIMMAGMKKLAMNLHLQTVTFFLALIFIELLVLQLVEWLQMLFGLQILPLTMWVLDLLIPFVNQKEIFFFVFLGLAALFLGTLCVQLYRYHLEPVNPSFNPAQQRKARAEKQQVRRWFTAFAVVFLLILSSVVGERVMASIEVQEKPVTPVTERAGHIHVPTENLIEKELNLYSFKSVEGTNVRFLAVRKSGENYGVALDACQICGVAGYYEHDGQILCKKCNSAIGVNTIGLKGGCNPIPIEYENKDGAIVIPVSEMHHAVDIFK